MSNARIELHIGRLRLHGFPPAQRHAIGAALRQELARLIAERGMPGARSPGGRLPNLNLAGMRIRAGAGGKDVGAQLARTIYGGLSR